MLFVFLHAHAAAACIALALAKAAGQDFVSAFVGVSWHKQRGQWQAEISHASSGRFLGTFVDEQEAARAFDEAARRLRPKGQAHGHRSVRHWQRLNFPTAAEKAFARDVKMPPQKKRKVNA